mmetsp:Transcript_13841/g.27189  ORF Transcript_13841/g.27189 Transcript_13841/m.27189 type:complete len:379 (-) Transcript_13841:128-1264(-)
MSRRLLARLLSRRAAIAVAPLASRLAGQALTKKCAGLAGTALFAMAVSGGQSPARAASSAAAALDFAVLKQQDSVTSSKIIDMLANDAKFKEISAKATKAILKRDEEDGQKLQQGIDLAINKGVIPANVKVEPVCKVYVTGKSAEAVSDEIIKGLGKAADEGCIMTLQGLSGTGKGTTVAMLKKKLPKATTWSNGNIFRCLTLLAATHAEKNQCSLQEAITPELLASYCKMLEFGKFNGKFDVKISGLGYELFVSDVCNTVLKGPKVGKNIPTVAGVTQGEVIGFVQNALNIMTKDGVNVLLEGREQTLNYIRTPYRFELVLDDVNIIGARRAAQRIGAQALKELESEQTMFEKLFGGPSSSKVATKISKVLENMAKE